MTIRPGVIIVGCFLVSVATPASRAVPNAVMAVQDPPARLSWWHANSPGPGTLVAVRRNGTKIRFVDNWAPCFTGKRIRPYVYKGGGMNQNAQYSRQTMKIWVDGGTLHAKRAFLGYARLPQAETITYKRISAAKAKRLIKPIGVSVPRFLAC